MRVAIVGAEARKFTEIGESRAIDFIISVLHPGDIVVSGHCHLGGIDIWAEEIADERGLETLIFDPKVLSWEEGFKPRNLAIARNCDILYNITVDVLPPGFKGMRHKECYHCHTNLHIKSGGCWTALQARRMGKPAHWHTINNGV